MDNQISLALMTKAKLVFEREDTFLAFPITPLVYDKKELNFTSNDAGQDVRRLLEFSRVVDRIPEGAVWGASSGRTLSDVYQDVLQFARIAASTRTATEEAALEKAKKFLFSEDASGFPHDTPVYVAYQQGRDAYIRALEDYAVAQSTATNSGDPTVKER